MSWLQTGKERRKGRKENRKQTKKKEKRRKTRKNGITVRAEMREYS